MKKITTMRKLDIAVAVITVLAIGWGLWWQAQIRHKNAVSCQTPGSVHKVTLSADGFSVPSLELRRCDQIVIVNTGRQDYELAFGIHAKHVEYPGFEMQWLSPNQYITIDAFQSGKYTLHDHLRDKARLKLDIRSQ